MIFPAICDVIRNLSGMWKMQFPDKLVRYLDVPQNFDPEIGGRSTAHELEELSRPSWTARGARPYDAEALRASIARLQREPRAWSRELYDLRRREPWKVPDRRALPGAARRHWCCRSRSSPRCWTSYLAAVRGRRRAAGRWTRRACCLTGSFCEQPPLGLIKTLERSGCYIVDDDFVQVHRWIAGDVPTDGDPLENLVQAFLSDAIASPTRYIDEEEKGEELRRAGARRAAPRACSSARRASATRRCSTSRWPSRAVEAAGIPWTAFKYAENTGQFQVIREQAGTFADSIKLWSGV